MSPWLRSRIGHGVVSERGGGRDPGGGDSAGAAAGRALEGSDERIDAISAVRGRARSSGGAGAGSVSAARGPGASGDAAEGAVI
jgi:hypothetical protein